MTDNTLVERKDTRVMGLGIGVFLIFFFSIISILICLVGATTPRPGVFSCGGTAVIGVVLLVLLTAERESRYVEDKSDQLQEYDQSHYPRVIIFAIMVLAVIAGLAGICVAHIGIRIHASPLLHNQKGPRQPLF
ncbi:unnamed protein product [Choristocarpus tenellus]